VLISMTKFMYMYSAQPYECMFDAETPPAMVRDGSLSVALGTCVVISRCSVGIQVRLDIAARVVYCFCLVCQWTFTCPLTPLEYIFNHFQQLQITHGRRGLCIATPARKVASADWPMCGS
jgi:hypothetical protein